MLYVELLSPIEIIVKGQKRENGFAYSLTGEVYTHLKIVFGENPKAILPEYNCNQDLVF